MSYTVNGKQYVADEGLVFLSKLTGNTSKRIWLPSSDMLEHWDIVPEPEPTPEEEEFADVEATESDYINALKELGVQFDE